MEEEVQDINNNDINKNSSKLSKRRSILLRNPKTSTAANTNNEEDQLPPTHPFSYEAIMKAPKMMPQVEVNGKTYEILHTGGFIKLYTMKGRLYWMAQGSNAMMNPDWKLHFAICKTDIPKAWNIIAKLFMELGCEFGMKVRLQSLIPENHLPTYEEDSDYSDVEEDEENEVNEVNQVNEDKEDKEVKESENNNDDNEKNKNQEAKKTSWSRHMWGREITVYIFTYHDSYKEFEVTLEDGTKVGLFKEDEQGKSFWKDFSKQAEKRLLRNGVKEMKISRGDRLFGKKYSSLRNEAFVSVNSSWKIPKGWEKVDWADSNAKIYPPNDAGYNAAGHSNRLKSKKLTKRDQIHS